MTTKIQRWGNSLALRIPKVFARDIHLEKGVVVNLAVVHGRLVVRPSQRSRYSLSALLKQVSQGNRHDEIMTGKPVGFEAW
jgi:antitoxin MazE